MHGQNNERQSLFDKGFVNRENGAQRLIKEYLSKTVDQVLSVYSNDNYIVWVNRTELVEAVAVNRGTLKTRDWKTRDSEKCRGGKGRTGKRGTRYARVENAGPPCMEREISK